MKQSKRCSECCFSELCGGRYPCSHYAPVDDNDSINELESYKDKYYYDWLEYVRES